MGPSVNILGTDVSIVGTLLLFGGIAVSIFVTVIVPLWFAGQVGSLLFKGNRALDRYGKERERK